MKPEAVFEVESGAKLSAYDVSAASMVRSQWYEAVRRFFERYDFWILPTAQVFPFDVALDWPREIAGRAMETYHEWMKVVLPVTMSGCPVARRARRLRRAAACRSGSRSSGPIAPSAAVSSSATPTTGARSWVAKHPPALLG